MPGGDIALDVNGDLLFGANGDLQVLPNDVTAAISDVQSRLLFFLGEDFLDVQGTGTPWTQKILAQKNPDLGAIRALLIAQIEGAPDIVAVTAMNLIFDPSARTLSGTWQANSVFGLTPVIQFGPVGSPVPTP
jgi:hypothetical protein